jgi:hypothetical protein
MLLTFYQRFSFTCKAAADINVTPYTKISRERDKKKDLFIFLKIVFIHLSTEEKKKDDDTGRSLS